MAKAGQIAVVAVCGLALGAALFVWADGWSSSASFLGHRLGAYQPPGLPPGWTDAVAREAKDRGLVLGQPDPFKEFLGYRDRTDIAVYRGEWSATRDGAEVRIMVETETSGGEWRVKSWSEQ